MERLSKPGLVFEKEHAIASCISPMVLMDLAGNLTYANPAVLKAWGYKCESEVLGRHAVDFWNDPARLIAYLEEVRANGSCVCELLAKRKDGSTFDAEILGSMTLDDRGQPIGMVRDASDGGGTDDKADTRVADRNDEKATPEDTSE